MPSVANKRLKLPLSERLSPNAQKRSSGTCSSAGGSCSLAGGSCSSAGGSWAAHNVVVASKARAVRANKDRRFEVMMTMERGRAVQRRMGPSRARIPTIYEESLSELQSTNVKRQNTAVQGTIPYCISCMEKAPRRF
eukprot:scaffold6886_cov164-Amphora_coffeaeformis.AAC.1